MASGPHRRDRTPRDELPVITIVVEKPHCPTCGGTDLKLNRSVTDSDNVVTRDARCLDPECWQRFFVIVE